MKEGDIINQGFRNHISDEMKAFYVVKELEEKYEKKFEYMSVRPTEVFEEYYSVICFPVEEPEIVFEARVSLEDGHLFDEYAVKKACKEFCQELICDDLKINGVMYIDMDSIIRGFEVNYKELSIKKIQSINADNEYIISIYYTPDSYASTDDLYKTINQMLKNYTEIKGFLKIYFLTNTIREKVQIYIESHEKLYMDFYEIIEYQNPMELIIENGRIYISKEEWNNEVKKYECLF